MFPKLYKLNCTKTIFLAPIHNMFQQPQNASSLKLWDKILCKKFIIVSILGEKEDN